MLSCEEVAKILGTEEDIPFFRRLQLRVHLFMCDRCVAYEKQLKALQSGFRKVLSDRTECCAERVKEIEDSVIERHQGS